MNYEEIVLLVSTTGIGAGVYTLLEVIKPWLKGIFNIPTVKKLITVNLKRLGIPSDNAYDAVIKMIVFALAYAIAWEMGNKGDLLVLLGRNAHSSYLGYALTAAVITSGDLAVNAFEQSRKSSAGAESQ